jgi:hypothetical protein
MLGIKPTFSKTMGSKDNLGKAYIGSKSNPFQSNASNNLFKPNKEIDNNPYTSRTQYLATGLSKNLITNPRFKLPPSSN